MKFEKVIAVRLPEEMLDIYKELAEECGLSVGVLTRVIIYQILNRKGLYEIDGFKWSDL
jgi:hypothetical protein